jgi:hypothetical protein
MDFHRTGERDFLAKRSVTGSTLAIMRHNPAEYDLDLYLQLTRLTDMLLTTR